MEKRTPHCKLTTVKALVTAGKVRTTHTARVGAVELSLGVSDMLDIVLAVEYNLKDHPLQQKEATEYTQ